MHYKGSTVLLSEIGKINSLLTFSLLGVLPDEILTHGKKIKTWFKSSYSYITFWISSQIHQNIVPEL